MALHKMTIATLLLAAAFIGAVPLLSEPPAMAQTAPSDPPRERERHFGSHIDGHIAFLKAELHITPDQEPLWSKVAQVMRADVAEFDQFNQQHPMPTKPTALQHLEERAAHTALRAKGEQRFLDAFRPLYEQMSDAQKQAADELLGHRREEF